MKGSALKIFTIVFGIVYTISFYVDLAMFRFYPETSKFYWKMHAQDGPAILWYGWLATSALISVVIALLVPRKLADKLQDDIVWIMPVAVVVVILIYEKQWFF